MMFTALMLAATIVTHQLNGDEEIRYGTLDGTEYFLTHTFCGGYCSGGVPSWDREAEEKILHRVGRLVERWTVKSTGIEFLCESPAPGRKRLQWCTAWWGAFGAAGGYTPREAARALQKMVETVPARCLRFYGAPFVSPVIDGNCWRPEDRP